MKLIRTTKTVVTGVLAVGLLGGVFAKDDEHTTTSSPAGPITNAAVKFKLAGAITNTTWEWELNNERIKFGKDGLIQHAEWEQRGLVTSWKVIDEHTVLLTIEQGRRTDRYAVLVFSADFTEYSGYDFHGARAIKPCKQIRE